MSTWVKLHRQIIDNEIFRHDHTAWHVFETLLVTVNKNTGKWSGGMFQLSELSGVQRNTLYKAIKRLEDAQMITRLVNTQYTVYSIEKWSEYQGTGETLGKQAVNAGETAGNTLTRIRNRNRTITKVIEPKAQYGNADVNILMKELYDGLGLKPIRVKAQRQAAHRLLNSYGLTKCRWLIKASLHLQEVDVYANKISSMEDVWSKHNKILLAMKKQKNNEIRSV